MTDYRVLAECAYVVGGAAVHHREGGAVVALDDETAAGLGDAVELASPPPQVRKSKLKAVQPEDGSLGEVGDGQ